MTVLDIIRDHIVAGGYDGLYNPDSDECGCGLDMLTKCSGCPLGGDIALCSPGVRGPGGIGPKPEAAT